MCRCLAQDILNKEISKIQNHYLFTFPLGSGKNVVQAAKKFSKQFGFDELVNVTKEHFDITKQI